MPPRVRPAISRPLAPYRSILRIGVLGLWLLAWGVLAGCAPPALPDAPVTAAGPPSTPAATPAAADSDAVPLTGTFLIWHSWTGEDHQAFLAILERINAAHPQLILAPQFVEAHQVPAQLLNAILAGDGPHLLLAPAAWYPELKADELITPLNDVVREEDIAHFVSPALFGLIHDSQLMGLPIWAETVMLYVNTDLMPWARVPDSTEELLALAASADRPLLGLYNNLFHLSWGFPAYGSVMFDASYHVVLDQSAGASAFLAWLNAAQGAPGITVSQDYEALKQAFLDQELALFVDGPWSLTEGRQALGNALRIRDIPSGPAGAARPWLTAEAVYLVAGQTEAQRQTSARIALLLADSEEILIETAHRLPAVQKDLKIGSEPLQEFRKLLPMAHHMVHRSEMTSVWRHGQDMLQRAVTGEEDAAALVARFVLRVNEENGQ